MDFLRRLFFLINFVFVASCTTSSYVWEQARGQWGLLSDARPNKEVLDDPSVPEDHKEKIQKIITYKKYFYDFWGKKEGEIYSETTFLEGDAVTYLVIASPYNKIEPFKNCFAIVGCFPYLGFFKEESAKKYQEKMEKKDYVTWKRPVYAYSTLGHFDDVILSSFFHYNDRDLTELIFHELFHTIFFVKNEVELNENLAMFFSEHMAEMYYGDGDDKRKERTAQKKKNRELRKLMAKIVNTLKVRFEEKEYSKQDSLSLTQAFVENEFLPQIKVWCQNNGVQNCSYLNKEWNNASMAAYLTYENKSEDLEKLFNQKSMSLKEFLPFLENEYKKYKDQAKIKTFTEFLLGAAS